MPAPFYGAALSRDVVFSINGRLLHNYILPRNCPRVTFYRGPTTTKEDQAKFFGDSTADFIIAVESSWILPIQRTVLYCYEFSPDTFELFDECAGYYISYEKVIPVSAKPIYNIMEELLKRNVEVRFMPSIVELAESVKNSSLSYSLIRMQYAQNGLNGRSKEHTMNGHSLRTGKKN